MIGTRLGPYQIVEKIGAGGMGEVYRAQDTKLHRSVAIKVLPDSFAADPDRMGRFEREARVLALLNHSHIAQVYGLETQGDRSFIIMELVEGETLAQWIARQPRATPPIDEIIAIARQIADGAGHHPIHGTSILPHVELEFATLTPGDLDIPGDRAVRVNR